MAASAAETPRSNRVKMLIIGAGIAGLSAASHLAKNGMTDFLVLEATNKIGGRIVSAQTAKHKLELGANWIHGVLGNPLYEIATANGLIDIVHVPKPHKVVAATEEGKQVPFQLLQEMYQAYVCFLRRCEEYFLCQYLPPEGINSVGEHLGLEMSMFLQRIENASERNIRELIFRCLLKRETCIAGCNSMSDIDLLQLGSYTELQHTHDDVLFSIMYQEPALNGLILHQLLAAKLLQCDTFTCKRIYVPINTEFRQILGGNIALPNGYSSILDPITCHIPPNSILKKQPVETIRWNFSEERCASGSANIIQDWTSESCDSDDSDVTVTGDVPKPTSTDLSGTPICEEDCSDQSELEKSEQGMDHKPKMEPDPGGSDHVVACASESNDITKTNIKIMPKRKRKHKGQTLPNVQVVCEDGTIFYADHVICTVPLGVLKAKSSKLFSPALPAYKLESINKLLFGTVNKIFLEYDRPFLNPEVSEVMLLWSDDGRSDSQDDLSSCWFRKIYSFAKVTDTLLLAWVSGKEAEFMENLTHEVIAETCTAILRKFLNDPFVPKPKCCVCTTWGSQPYTRGSYTAIAVGASQDDIENVAQPLYSNDRQVKPVVLFAGEHTHSSFYSTVHGAYLTGRSAAQILVQPDTPEEIVLECDEENTDLSAWIQSISLQ